MDSEQLAKLDAALETPGTTEPVKARQERDAVSQAMRWAM
jgi:hypothetical protein